MQFPFVHRYPRDRVAGRWLVAPALTALEADGEKVHAGRGPGAAPRLAPPAGSAARRPGAPRGVAQPTEKHACRPILLDLRRRYVLALGGRVLLRLRQCDPQLIELQGAGPRNSAVMPNTAAGFHPLQATSGHHAGFAGRILVDHAPADRQRQGGDTRMTMDASQPLAAEGHDAVIQ